MPKTAYSNYFAKELDVAQLLTLTGYIRDGVQQETTTEFREWVRKDAVCPSCGANGGNVVIGSGRSPKRQEHFRFTNQDGQDAHRKFCAFSNNENGILQTEDLVNFGKSRNNETRLVRLFAKVSSKECLHKRTCVECANGFSIPKKMHGSW